MPIQKMALSSLRDEELILLAPKNQQAYTELVQRFMSYILRKISKYHLIYMDKDDLIQECLIGFVKAVKSYNSERGSFAPYAHRCIDTAVATAVGKVLSDSSQLVSTYENFDDCADTLENTSVSPEEIVFLKEQLAELIFLAKATLSSMELSVLEGRLLGLSYSEIAKRMSISVKQVDNAYQRIRNKLRSKYKD